VLFLSQQIYTSRKGGEVKIEWIGHACFCITSQAGLKILTDPYETGFRDIINYGPVNESADIVTVSHEHGDHNHVAAVSGDPTVVKATGVTSVKGVDFKGIAVYHDRVQGTERGPNTIFTFEVDGIRLTHLGDLGHPLSAEQMGELAGTQVLFAPTGGPAATLELEEVIDLWERLKPAVVIPMHFRTERCSFPKYSADDLVKMRPAAKKAGASEISILKDELPEAIEIVILEPSR
jgi:L-ascorbate metabolism protein UlaG (beta-lactamase superfamily)